VETEAYSIAADVEEEHWWFCGRRAILRSVLNKLLTPSDVPRRILEVGCGNGGNLPLLAEYGQVTAVELDDRARARAAERGVAQLEKGWLPDGLPFNAPTFDLILALDVVEHVDDDSGAIRALQKILSPGGMLVITVPAYQWLWSEHDELTHHKRRYNLAQCKKLLAGNGLNVCYATYFNSLLFPLAVSHIKLHKYFSNDPYGGLRTPPPLINRLLLSTFALESRLIPGISIPCGISILVCATPMDAA
jgi:SAM-dependent methyltransferase